MRTFDDRHKIENLKYAYGMKHFMSNRNVVLSFPEHMEKRIKELQKKSKMIMLDPTLGEKAKQEMVAKCEEKIKEIKQSICRFYAQRSM